MGNPVLSENDYHNLDIAFRLWYDNVFPKYKREDAPESFIVKAAFTCGYYQRIREEETIP